MASIVWRGRALIMKLPHQDLGRNGFLLMYKTKVRKGIFQNFEVYDQQENLKIGQKITSFVILKQKMKNFNLF